MSKIAKIEEITSEILKKHPEGMRFVDLIRNVRDRLSKPDEFDIPTYIQWLPQRNPDKFFKPARGWFQLREFADKTVAKAASDESATNVEGAIPESSFYQPFADYLVSDLEECGRAIVVGGNKLGNKWGTPDVVGITLPSPLDIYKPPMEIVSAEIKSNSNDLVVAFGQACSYQLFSHRSYIVVPSQSKELDRLESLCQVFGIGLVLIAKMDSKEPSFVLRVRALRREPDPYFVNVNLKLLPRQLFEHAMSTTA